MAPVKTLIERCRLPDEPTNYDEVIYTVHIDGDNISDLRTHIRFGQNGDDDWPIPTKRCRALV